MGNKLFSIERYILFAFLLLVAGVIFSAVITYVLWEAQEDAEESAHNEEASLVTQAIEQHIEKIVEVLYGGVGLYAASDFVDRAEWKAFFDAQRAFGLVNGLQAVEFVEYVPHEKLDEYLERVRNDTTLVPEGYPDFTVQPDTEDIEHYIVTYVEPMKGNEPVFGLDMSFTETRLEALEQARDTGRLAISDPVVLLQRGGATALLLMLPVYYNDMPTETLAGRRSALYGFVFAVVRTDESFRPIPFDELAPSLGFELFATVDGEEILLFGIKHENNAETYEAEESFVRTFTVGGKEFLIHFDVLDTGIEFDAHLTSYLVFGGGTLLSFLTAGIIFVIGRSRQAAITLADTMTKDLRKTTLNLEKEKDRVERALTESERAKQQLEKQTSELEELSRSMVGRELKMVELKEQIKKYEGKSRKK